MIAFICVTCCRTIAGLLGTTRALLITADHVLTSKNAKLVKGERNTAVLSVALGVKDLALRFGEQLIEPEIRRLYDLRDVAFDTAWFEDVSDRDAYYMY